MAKQSDFQRALSNIDAQIKSLQDARDVLITAAGGDLVRRERPKVRTKLPKPGELRDRAILGGEPSL